MHTFTVYTIPPLLSSLLFLFLGGVVYFNNRKSKINLTFTFICLATFWWQFSWFLLFNTKNESVAGQLVKIGYAGIILIPIFFFHFLFHFLKKPTKIDKYLLYFSYLAGLIFEITLFTTNYFINYFYKYPWGFYPKAGPLHIFYLLVLAVLALRGLYLLFSFLKKKKEISCNKYHQTKYLFVALIFYILASVDFLDNYGAALYPIGFLFISVFLGITTYAIIKHYLFGIKLILTELLVGVIAIILLIQALIAPTIWTKISGFGLLFLFAIAGYFLIKSVLREITIRAELQKAYSELKQLDKAKSEFISIAAHQLRTPLTAIKGYMSLLLEGSYGNLPASIKKPLENVYKSNERLIKLINDLLNISKIEAGKMELYPEKSSLESVISNAVNDLRVEAKNKGIKLIWEKPKTIMPQIIIDKEKIRQVIINVIDNAIKYTESGKVVVTIKKKSNSLIIKVSDTGRGLTKGEISRLFDSFTRGEAGNRLWTEGTGLGLYVAKKFISMHKGKIWAKSKGKGKGSTFYIELPFTFQES